MNILYYTLARAPIEQIPHNERGDYMSDLLFHGLRELYGEEVVDYPKKTYMYDTYQDDPTKLWGKGFSSSMNLKDIKIDRDNDLGFKIINNFYNLIVLSVHHTIHRNPVLLYNTLESFKAHGVKSKIAIVDGNDEVSAYDKALEYTPHCFKREIINDNSRFIPIWFGIPKQKIVKEIPLKDKFISDLIPADFSSPNRVTHKYNTEQEYYQEYQRSWMGFTCIKGGADCMRHTELLANGTIPIFTDIERVSKNTLVHLPKKLLSDIKNLPFLNLENKIFSKNEIKMNYLYIIENKFDKQYCTDLIYYLLDYTRQKLTTESLAKYFLEKLN